LSPCTHCHNHHHYHFVVSPTKKNCQKLQSVHPLLPGVGGVVVILFVLLLFDFWNHNALFSFNRIIVLQPLAQHSTGTTILWWQGTQDGSMLLSIMAMYYDAILMAKTQATVLK
jgi:hypothetical protein